MKKVILFLSLGLLISTSAIAQETSSVNKEDNQIINKDDLLWRVGGKIHFEEDSGTDYIGIKKINEITKNILKNIISVDIDVCADNTKVILKKEHDKIMMTHY